MVDVVRGSVRFPRSLGSGTAAAVLASLMLGTPSDPAESALEAEEPRALILISHDGSTFSEGPARGIFTSVSSVVPGDAVGETFWIRSAADSEGLLRIDVEVARAADPVLAAGTVLEVHGGCSPVSMSLGEARSEGRPRPVLSHEPLAPGETIRLDAVLEVSAGMGEQRVLDSDSRPVGDAADSSRWTESGRRGTLAFDLSASLSPAHPTAAGGGSRSERCAAARAGADGLSRSGAPHPMRVALLGAACAAAGAILLLTGRKAAMRGAGERHGTEEQE